MQVSTWMQMCMYVYVCVYMYACVCVCMYAGSCRQRMYDLMNEDDGYPRWVVEHAFTSAAVSCRGCIIESYFGGTLGCEMCDVEHRQTIAASDDIGFRGCSVRWPCRFRRFFQNVYALIDAQFDKHILLIKAAVSNHQLHDPEYAERLPITPSDVDSAINRVTVARVYRRGRMTSEEWEKCRRIPDLLLISDAPNYPFVVHQLSDFRYRVGQGKYVDDDLFEAELAKLEHECIESTDLEFGSGPSDRALAEKAWASIKHSVRRLRTYIYTETHTYVPILI
jgi:hypothetical protein